MAARKRSGATSRSVTAKTRSKASSSSSRSKTTGKTATTAKAGRPSRTAAAVTKTVKAAAARPAAAKKATSTGTAGARTAAVAALEKAQQRLEATLDRLAGLAATRESPAPTSAQTSADEIDHSVAAFQRLMAEAVDDRLAWMLPPLIGLRHEMARQGEAGDPSTQEDFHRRGVEALDRVLEAAGVQVFEPEPAEPFDPIIHVAVGEAQRDDLPDGAVAETVWPGFRSGRGKGVAPARVGVNRR